MKAKGVVFDLDAFKPEPVPDELNFAMTPLLKPLFDLNPPGTMDANGYVQRWKDTNGLNRLKGIGRDDPETEESLPDHPKWRLGRRISLEDWQEYYRNTGKFPRWAEARSPAEDVAKALSLYDLEFQELETASRRPHAQFDVFYEEETPLNILLPHLAVVRNLIKVGQLRALAALASGDEEKAAAEVDLMFALMDSIKDEPFLISHLVRIASLDLTLQTIWEGVVDDAWPAEHLKRWRGRVATYDLGAEMRRCYEAERAFGVTTMALLRRDPWQWWSLAMGGVVSGDRPPVAVLTLLLPRGWTYFEQLNYSCRFEEYLQALLPDEGGALNPQLARERSAELDGALEEESSVRAFLGHRLMMRVLFPALSKVKQKSALAQATLRMADIAIGLQLYRLENQQYPESLDKLAPDYIDQPPQDPVTGKSFRYQLVSPDSYLLWSIGWNGVDDGGVIVLDRDDPERIDETQGDWVWPAPEGLKIQEGDDS